MFSWRNKHLSSSWKWNHICLICSVNLYVGINQVWKIYCWSYYVWWCMLYRCPWLWRIKNLWYMSNIERCEFKKPIKYISMIAYNQMKGNSEIRLILYILNLIICATISCFLQEKLPWVRTMKKLILNHNLNI